jgi:outer membrane lipoprotein-sorting protein
MKKFTLSLLTLALVVFSTALKAQSVDEILAKHFAAVGQDKLSQVETMRAEGMVVLAAMGIELPFTQYYAKGGKIRVESSIQGMTILQVIDGEKGWMINPMMGPEPQEMSELDLANMMLNSDVEGPFFNYKEKGHTVEFVGKDQFQGADVYKLKLTMKNGMEVTYFLDADAYLPLKTEAKVDAMGMSVTSTAILGDYKTVDGIMMAFSIESSAMGQSTVIKMNKVEFNVPVDQAMFKKPGK